MPYLDTSRSFNMDDRDLEHRLTEMEISLQELKDFKRETLVPLINKFNMYEARWGLLVMMGSALMALFLVFKGNVLAFFKAH